MAHLSCLLAKLLAKSNHSPEQSEAAAEAGMQLIHRLTERLERDDTVVSRANLSWAGSTLSQPASQAHGVGIGCSSNPSNSRKVCNYGPWPEGTRSALGSTNTLLLAPNVGSF